MKILAIDDEMTALTKMKVLLSAYGDCTMATNSAKGLQLCAAAIQDGTPYDLITIDIQMPGASGLDLVAAIKRLETSHNVPASKKIMVSASGTVENLLSAKSKGCDGFIVKPVKRDTLAEKMADLGLVKPDPAADEGQATAQQRD
jgi:two-component system, chemotaxis family, chemotaxis protein CheY